MTLLTSPSSNQPFFFSIEKYLGHQVYSYGQLLSVTFTSETSDLLPDSVTVLLEGSGITLSADLSPQPTLDHAPRLAPRHSFLVRYKNKRRNVDSLGTFIYWALIGLSEQVHNNSFARQMADHMYFNCETQSVHLANFQKAAFSLKFKASPTNQLLLRVQQQESATASCKQQLLLKRLPIVIYI